MSAFQYLMAMANKRLHPGAAPPPRTTTPIASLSQTSRVDIANTPIILAREAGSLVEMLPASNLVSMIGTLRLPLAPSFITQQGAIEYYRAYLSQSDNQDELPSFISMAVQSSSPTRIIELRLYRPYNEVVPGDSDEWGFWLLDDPDPKKGGMIGCPIMQGRDDDGSIQYQRSWNPSGLRVRPYEVQESILDAQGVTSSVSHTMMHYQRSLTDPKLSEYMLVSAVNAGGEASVCMWLGLDLDPADLTAYPPAV